MAGLYNIEAEYDDLAARNPYTEADTPTTLGAGWRAQLNLFVREETFISESLNYGQMMNNRAKIIGQLGGNEELAGIYGSSMPAYHMQRLRKLEQNGLLEDSPEWHTTPEHIRESYRHVREMEDRYPDQVLSDEALDEERNANFASWRSVEEDIIRRAPWYASFLGAMQGAVTDPLVVATMPFGGALAKSGTTALKTGLRFAAIESAIAVGTEIPIQAAVYKYKRKLDAPWGFADSAMNVLAAGAGGAVLGGFMGAGGQAGRNFLDSRKLLKATEEMRRQMKSGAIVLNRAEVEALETLEATARIDSMNPLVDPGLARIEAGNVGKIAPSADEHVNKAREHFDKYGVSDHVRIETRQALDENVGPDAAKAYDDEYERLVQQAIEQRTKSPTEVDPGPARLEAGNVGEVPKGEPLLSDQHYPKLDTLKEKQEELLRLTWLMEDTAKGPEAITDLQEYGFALDEVVIESPAEMQKSLDDITRDISRRIVAITQDINKPEPLAQENKFNFTNATEAYHYALEVSRLQDEAGLPVDVEDVVKDFQEEMVTIWHGGPHEFDAFDMNKILTGEGMNAYGRGLYFSERRGVAGNYTNAGWVPDKGIELNGEQLIGKQRSALDADAVSYAIDALTRFDGDKNQALKYLADGGSLDDDAIKWINKNITGEKAKVIDNPGHLYEVNIPKSTIDNMLDWDKPLSEQPEVMKVIKELPWLDDPKTVAHKNGEWLYREISEGSTDKETSKWLNEAGIPGIRYLDGTSRSAGEGTRNFVIFDDQLPVIVKRNDQPIKAPKPEPVGKGEVKKISDVKQEYEELAKLDIDELDRRAFGHVSDEEIKVSPEELNIYLEADIENAIAKMEGDPDWVDTVDLSEPVEVVIKQDGQMYLEDGHHRYIAAKERGEKLNAIVEVKAKPIDKILNTETHVKLAKEAQSEIVIKATKKPEAPAKPEPPAKPEAKPAVVIDDPPRAIVKKMAVEPADPNVSSRTGIVSDDEYMAVLEEWKRLSEEGDAKMEVTTEVDGEMIIRNVGDVVEELDTLDNTFNDLRLCSLGGKA